TTSSCGSTRAAHCRSPTKHAASSRCAASRSCPTSCASSITPGSRRRTTQRCRWPRVSWCSRHSSPARRSPAQTAAIWSREPGAAAPAEPRSVRRRHVVTGDLAVRPARLDDLNDVVELRLALLREYSHAPMYEHLRPDAETRAQELFSSQLL